MPNAAKSVLVFLALASSMTYDAVASESDISTFNTLQTAAPATIGKVEVLHPSFRIRYIMIQPYGGLEQPMISFTVENNSAVTISKLYLTGVLRAKGRVVPYAAQDFNLSIPGGLQPGERKHFDLEATLYGDWNSVTDREVRNSNFLLTLDALDDARGGRIVK